MSDEQEIKKGEEEGKIELDAETYQALLDKLGDLEEKVRTGEGEIDEVTRLAQEAEERKGETAVPDLDALTNKQLVEALEKGINESVVAPLMTRISEMEIKAEIRDLMTQEDKEGTKPYADFWDYRTEIYDIAKDNPNLPLARCYKLAKEQVGEKIEPKTGERVKGEDPLRHLPPAPRRKSPISERPGAAISSTSEEEPKTRKEAATKAYEEVFGDK